MYVRMYINLFSHQYRYMQLVPIGSKEKIIACKATPATFGANAHGLLSPLDSDVTVAMLMVC